MGSAHEKKLKITKTSLIISFYLRIETLFKF